MAYTNNAAIQSVGNTIKTETNIGGNTAARVGGVIEDIGFAFDAKDANVGYYVATINGGTISATAPNYKLTTGGVIRLKMPAAGTTASTLTIGNASSVTLWYNGAAVSSTNTWEQGEIISVFYDGTKFMASNAQGGGGKAEKISYDNTISGMASSNVQEAVDELVQSSSFEEDAPYTNHYNFYITSGGSGKWSANTSSSLKQCYVVPTSEGEQFEIKANSNYAAQYAFLHSVNASNNADPDFSSGRVFTISAGETKRFTVPANTYFLYICQYNQNRLFLPDYTHRVQSASEKLSELNEISKISTGLYDDNEVIAIDDATAYPRYACSITGDGDWVSNSVTSSIFIPIANAKSITIAARSTAVALYCFTTEVYESGDTYPEYARGESNRHKVEANESFTITNIPFDAVYLCVGLVAGSGTYIKPSSITIQIAKTLEDRVSELEQSGIQDMEDAVLEQIVPLYSFSSTRLTTGPLLTSKWKDILMHCSLSDTDNYAAFVRQSDDGHTWTNIQTGAAINFTGYVSTVTATYFCILVMNQDTTAEINVGEVQIIRKRKPKTIVCIGDSLTHFRDGENKDQLSWTDYLAARSGCNVINVGCGGNCITTRMVPTATPSTQQGSYPYNEGMAGVDMSHLVKAWVEDDWTIVDACVAWLYANYSRDYRASIARLKTVRPSDVDIVIFGSGTNDMTLDVAKGAKTDTTPYTFGGAIEEIVRMLNSANGEIEIFFFSPIVRYYNNIRDDAHWSDNWTSQNPNWNGLKLPDLADYYAECCKYHHVKFLDWYWGLGWNQNNFSHFFEDNDGTHPYKGFDWMGERMYAWLNSVTSLVK